MLSKLFVDEESLIDMNDELIIRDEARNFAKRSLRLGDIGIQPVEQIRAVKRRLNDFYTPETKAIFLDEVKTHVTNEIIKHRNDRHDGQASPSCEWEKQAEKLLFYLRQEVGILPTVAHQRKPTNPERVRNKVFVSYSHIDKEYLQDIKRHFIPFHKQIDFWDDSRVSPGQKWKDEISKAIDETKVAILLVSADFFCSEFINTVELPPLLKAAEEDGAVILIVVLKPCLFEEFPELNQFQAMNPPSHPVSKMDDNEKEELIVNLVRQTKRILENEEKINQ